jgi:hypothetical protein
MQSLLIGSLACSALLACTGDGVTTGHDVSGLDVVPRQQPADLSPEARATRDTHVAYDVTGLEPWRTGDTLQLVLPRTGHTMDGVEQALLQPPRPGDTAIAGERLNWKHTGLPLLDAADGATAMVTQLVSRRDGAREYAALGRAGVAPGLELRDGQAAALTAALAPVAQDRTLQLRWRGDQFAALTAQAGADAEPGAAATVAISAALPGALRAEPQAAYDAGLPSLVTFPPLPMSAIEQRVSYGDPFDGVELATALYTARVPVPTVWGQGTVLARFLAVTPVEALAQGGALAPRISPVREVSRDGTVVRWQAPKLGKASRYTVALRRVDGSAQGVELPLVTTLQTTASSVQLPAALLTVGTTYVVTITALTIDGAAFGAADYVAAPFTL